ncbi:MAG: tripartite tricarboxylate transporter TctB family protein [Desulfobacteraceae bacterium]|nr:tripartite tricarboxylate transporter TctB family protein [Desulfobacteraceae bacterium]
MKTQRSANVVSGCFLAVLGVLVLIASSQIRGGMEERLPPRTLPYAVGATILVGGLMLAIKSLRPVKEEVALKWPDRNAIVRIAILLMMLAVYLLLVTPIGFATASALYVAFSIWFLKRSAIWTAIIIGVVTGVLSHFVFYELLGLSLPMGTIFFD